MEITYILPALIKENRERKALEAEEMSKWPPVDKSKFNDDWMFKSERDHRLRRSQKESED